MVQLLDYFEPYDASNASGYGAAPTTGYPEVKNNRVEEDQDFTEQYGILLNGNRWTIGTTVTAQTTASATGTSGTYAIVVEDGAGTIYEIYIAEKSVSQSQGQYKNARSCDGTHTYPGTYGYGMVEKDCL